MLDSILRSIYFQLLKILTKSVKNCCFCIFVSSDHFFPAGKLNVGNRLKRVFWKSDGCASYFWGINGRSKFRKVSANFFRQPSRRRGLVRGRGAATDEAESVAARTSTTNFRVEKLHGRNNHFHGRNNQFQGRINQLMPSCFKKINFMVDPINFMVDPINFMVDPINFSISF